MGVVTIKGKAKDGIINTNASSNDIVNVDDITANDIESLFYGHVGL